MSNTIIQVENLGKKYLIKHQQQGSYTALRDVITDKAKSFGKKIISPRNHKQSSIYSRTEEFWALKDVSFKVEQGEVIGIIGPNGAGKSTLLKIISRITEPTKGRIRINGRVASLLEVGTGFHPELTGRENIFLNGAILGMSRNEIKKKFDEIVDFAEVEKFLDTPVKRYSSGMYVRLAFAVAAHLESEILVVDELLAVGDATFQKKCLGKMGEAANEGRTVLFVSHNMGVISKLCEKSLLLHYGNVMNFSKTSDIVQQYNNMGIDFDEKRKENKCLLTSEYADVVSLSINGQNSNEIFIPSVCNSLEINIKCLVYCKLVVYPEFRLFDFLGNCLFYYTPRLDGVQQKVSPGEIDFDFYLQIPNITKGKYSLGLYIVKGDPFEENIVEDDCCKMIVFEGTPLYSGYIVQYDKGNGAILLQKIK